MSRERRGEALAVDQVHRRVERVLGANVKQVIKELNKLFESFVVHFYHLHEVDFIFLGDFFENFADFTTGLRSSLYEKQTDCDITYNQTPIVRNSRFLTVDRI